MKSTMIFLAGLSWVALCIAAASAQDSQAIVPLFDRATRLEPDVVEDTPDAIITHVGDRVRDRHARESQFHAYDHYLSWYWEYRTVSFEVVDRVAKGGTEITFNITSLWPLDTPDFRAFYQGKNTVAEYAFNTDSKQVDETHYSATINSNPLARRPLAKGDVIEIEFSPFLMKPPRGRANYYGTAMVYVVGSGGMVPWHGVGERLAPEPLPPSAWLGGRTTLPQQYSAEPHARFKQMATNIAPRNAQPFMLGRRLHHTDFTSGAHSEPGNPSYAEQAGKIGPRFVAHSCVSCHVNNGRALPAEIGKPMLQSVVKVGSDAGGAPHAKLGRALQSQSLQDKPEASIHIAEYTTVSGQFADGEKFELRRPKYAFESVTPEFFSVRSTPALVGLGLLEAVDEGTIRSLADPDDRDHDGISGRVSIVRDPQTQVPRIGRFGYKASQPKLMHQIAAALNSDMGIATSVFPELDHGADQPASATQVELADAEVDQLYRYVATLGVPPRRKLTDSAAQRGETLFVSSQCAKCHTPTTTTSPYHPLAELRHQTIQPYTDLLLHDLGPGLADNLGEADATGAEWRTAPLWGIGLTGEVSQGHAYLHDGRARSLAEAILWHGGEAEGAKEAFRNMSAVDRAALLTFLESL